MARRRTVEEKNYDELIKASEEKIATLTTELKEEKTNLKKLKKDKNRYEEILAKKKKEDEIQAAAELIVSSGKTLAEIKELLSK